MAYYEDKIQVKAFNGLKNALEDKEDLEIAYGEAVLINEKRLMTKVLRSIRVVNNLKKEEKYQQFNAIAHFEVVTLSKIFKAWKHIVADEKQRIDRENQKQVEILNLMNLAKIRF